MSAPEGAPDEPSPPAGAGAPEASAPPAALAPLPPLTTWSWILVAIGLCALLFAVRFVADTHLALVAPEECLTGGIAREVAAHGLRFPLTDYTPNPDEAGALVLGILAIPLFKLLGPSVLALKILAHLFSTARELAGLALLHRLLRSERRRWIALLAYVVLVALAPRLFTFMAMQSQGTHNAGAAVDLVLLVLLARRVDRPSPGRVAGLWLALGAMTAWKHGTLVVAAIAAAHELLSARRGLTPRRSSALAPACFLLAYAPRIAWSAAVGFRDLRWLLLRVIDLRSPGSIGDVLGEAWLLVADRSAIRAALLALGLAGWIWLVKRRRETDGVAPYLAAYVASYAAILVVYNQGIFFCQYLYPLLSVPAALGVARLPCAVEARAPAFARSAWTGAGVLVVLALLLSPSFLFRPSRVAAMARDTERAACAWQLGEAFSRDEQDIAGAVLRCGELGGEEALECASGIGLHGSVPALASMPEGWREAYAFGVGRSALHGSSSVEACQAMPEAPLRDACSAGRRWECLAYADMICSLQGRTMGAPRCPLAPAPLEGFARASQEAWRRLPQEEPRCELLELMGDEKCRDVYGACFGER